MAVAVPEEATPILTAPPTLMAPEKEPEKCYKKTVGEEATFLESAKDYFNQFKAMPAQKHWICLKNYFSQKCSSVMSLAPPPVLFSVLPFGDASARFFLHCEFFWFVAV